MSYQNPPLTQSQHYLCPRDRDKYTIRISDEDGAIVEVLHILTGVRVDHDHEILHRRVRRHKRLEVDVHSLTRTIRVRRLQRKFKGQISVRLGLATG